MVIIHILIFEKKRDIDLWKYGTFTIEKVIGRAKYGKESPAIILRSLKGETTDYTWVDIKDFREYTESEQAMRNHVERYRPYLDEIFSDM